GFLETPKGLDAEFSIERTLEKRPELRKYPVVLDIENHCTFSQQKEMARILKEVLGDYLLTEAIFTDDPTVLPSPDELKYKVLVRSPQVTPLKALQSMNLQLPLWTKAVEPEFDKLLPYLRNVLYDTKTNYSCIESPQLSEFTFDNITKSKNSHDFIKQTQGSVMRVYPKGTRQDSSNMNPLNMWNLGVQMVNSEFNPLASNDVSKQRLTLRIISAQYLSRRTPTRDIVDPYVKVFTYGVNSDCQEEKTRAIIDNGGLTETKKIVHCTNDLLLGLNPTWNETIVFEISVPELCLVRFVIFDRDIIGFDDILGSFCLPLTTIQTGYRHIHLRAMDDNLTYSTLFVHVDVQHLTDDSCVRL
ncbi:unnamed protein product, partial [Didymodactylos carnosus]